MDKERVVRQRSKQELPTPHQRNYLTVTTVFSMVWLLLSQSTVAVETTNQTKAATLEKYLVSLGYACIPLKRDDQNQPSAEAVIEGKRRTLLVDTGWSYTTVRSRIARKWKTLGESRVLLFDTFLGLRLDTNALLMPDLLLGTARFTNQPTLRQDSRLPTGSYVDGVLGCDFLHRNFCILDSRKPALFLRGSSPPDEVRSVLAKTLQQSGYRKVNLKMLPELVFACRVKVNGEPLIMLVDSGSCWTLLANSAAQRCQLRTLPGQFYVDGAEGKKSRGYRTIFDSFEIDKFPVPVATTYLGVSDLARVPSNASVEGLLGNEMLIISQAIIDFASRSMWIVPSKTDEQSGAAPRAAR